MIRACVYGYGNIGKAVLSALKTSPDFEIVGVVSSSLQADALEGVKVVRDIAELENVEVAILCTPSRTVPDLAASLLEKGICTVDSFDMGSGDGFNGSCYFGGNDSSRNYLYKFWSGYEHGTYRCGKGD